MPRARPRGAPAALVVPLPSSTVCLLRHSSSFPSLPRAPLPTLLRDIVATLLAVQAQDFNAALLSLWLRLPCPRPSRAALAPLVLAGSARAGLARVWANRSTLHVVSTHHRCFLAAAVRDSIAKQRYAALRRQGVGELAVTVFEDVRQQVKDSLADGRTVASADVRARVGRSFAALQGKVKGRRFVENDVKSAQVCIRCSVFVLTTAEGTAERVTTPGDGGRINIIASPGKRELPEIDVATVECARRYFGGYGPATEQDFRYWLGIPAAQSKAAVTFLMDSGELETVLTEAGETLMPAGASREPSVQGVRLVGRFEPVLLAHKNKDWVVSDKWRRSVWTNTADIAPCVLIRGRIRGAWTRKENEIRVRMFNDCDEGELGRDDVQDVIEKAHEILKDFWEVDGVVGFEREIDGRWVLMDEDQFCETMSEQGGRSKERAKKRRRQS